MPHFIDIYLSDRACHGVKSLTWPVATILFHSSFRNWQWRSKNQIFSGRINVIFVDSVGFLLQFPQHTGSVEARLSPHGCVLSLFPYMLWTNNFVGREDSVVVEQVCTSRCNSKLFGGGFYGHHRRPWLVQCVRWASGAAPCRHSLKGRELAGLRSAVGPALAVS